MIKLRLLAALVAVACVLGALAWARSSLIEHGRELQRTADREANAEVQRLASQAGQQLAAQARQEAHAARTHATTLQLELAHARPSLVVAPRCHASPAAAHAHGGLAGGTGLAVRAGLPVVAAGSTAASQAGSAADLAAPPGPGPGPGADDLRLTADAVGLWNSALAGHPLPGPTCGTDAAAAGACAAGETSLTLSDAWHNHIENAASCREDRARHARLIDWLNRVHGQPQP